jgi:uncharacterized membrane protein
MAVTFCDNVMVKSFRVVYPNTTSQLMTMAIKATLQRQCEGHKIRKKLITVRRR